MKVLIALFAVLVPVARLSAAADEALEVPGEWTEALAGLRADDFAVRERAAAGLVALSRDALPWLEGELANAQTDADPDYSHRIASAIEGIRERVNGAELDGGLPVKLNLNATTPEDVLAAIEAIGPRPLVGKSDREIWDNDLEETDFAFEGNYWGAIDKMFEVFPPAASKSPGREQVDEEHDLLRLFNGDFAAVAQPHAVAGVLRVRAARTALEHSNGQDFLTVTLVPKLEPTYLPEEVALLLREVRFADGATVAPDERVRRFEKSGYRTATSFQPGRDFTWALPVDKKFDLGSAVVLDLKAQVKVRRMHWEKRDLPEVGSAAGFSPEITVTLEEQEEDYLKLKFAGDGVSRIDFNQYSRHGSQRLFEVLDTEGDPIKISIRSSSSGSDGDDKWHQSFKCYFEDSEPASVRALLPGELLTKQTPLVISDVPLPGMGRE